MFTIFKNKSFTSLLSLQTLGAFNDNFFRTLLVSLITFGALDISGNDRMLLINFAMVAFMLPFFIFSAIAGQIADKYDQANITKFLKFAEVIIAIIAAYCYAAQSISGLLFSLFLMGTQSAFFGPIKYSILPNILPKEHLISANSFVAGTTYLAILSGIIVGGSISHNISSLSMSSIMISVALLGFIFSLAIKEVPAHNTETKIQKNILNSTVQCVKLANTSEQILMQILGISWFWLLTSVLSSQLPSIVTNFFNGTNDIYILLLTVFCIGIGLGALVTQKLTKGDISTSYVPISSIIISIILFDFSYAIGSFDKSETTIGVQDFITSISGIHISIDMFFLAAFAGMYVVPLTALLQVTAPKEQSSQIIASNNIVNSLFIVGGALFCMLVIKLTNGVIGTMLILFISAVANAFVTAIICMLLPHHILRMLIKKILQFVYKAKIEGLENLKAQENKNTLIVANHTSLLDGIILWALIKDDLYFAVDVNMSKKLYVRLILSVTKYFAIDNNSPLAIRDMAKEINNGHKVVIFPEGRITTTGTIMKIYPGSAMLADYCDADILPICIEGSQYSIFAYFGAKFRHRPKAKIHVKVLPAVKFEIAKEITGKARNKIANNMLYDLMTKMKVDAFQNIAESTLYTTFINSLKDIGGSHEVLEDASRKPLSMRKVFIGSIALAKYFKRIDKDERVGFLLPNSAGSVVVFLALQACGKVPCMLNFSAGVGTVISCINTVLVKTIYTSREFIDKAELHELEKALIENGCRLIYLEDVKENISKTLKFKATLGLLHPFATYKRLCNNKLDANNPAVILFTSGSEGVPKAVVLSHKSIQTNRIQAQAILSFGLLDKIFNALPMFHSLGLTIGTLLTVLSGIKTFMYPSPLHYKVIPLLVYDTNSTAVIGTDTFLKSYAKNAHPYDMYSIRFAIAGGEKLKEDTRDLWNDKFGIRIFEGYGATETAPVISVNTHMFYRRHTVGRLLPNIEPRIEKIPGIEEGGRLFVKGNNNMLGYILASNPGVIQPLEDNWYDTGDIVTIDEDGFLKIVGRAKRFAKVAGEMISLTAVEQIVSKVYPDTPLAVVAVNDEKKGEQLVLFISKKDIDIKDIKAEYKAQGFTELGLPKYIQFIEEIPIMPTGKVDYVSVNKMAKELFETA